MLPSMQAFVEMKTKRRQNITTVNIFVIHQSIISMTSTHLVESSDSIGVGTVDNFWHILAVVLFGLSSLHQHHLGLLRVPAGTGRQELCSPVKPHPFAKKKKKKVQTTRWHHWLAILSISGVKHPL